jgi:O-antigen/teichoic acid export membrane protein
MSIARKAVLGALWTSGSNYLSQGVGMLSLALLGRLLLKEDFGLFGTANSIIQFVFILSAFSFNLSIVQTQEQREHLYSTAMLLNLALAVLSLLFTGIAILGYMWFRALTTTEITVILSLSVVNILNLFGQHFDAILQRNLKFRTISMIAFVMNLANPVTAVTCAWAGLGVWSLVAGQSAGAVVFLTGSWLFAGWSISFAFSRETARWFLSQGWRYLSSRSLEVVYTELDRLVIKRFSDYEQVGIYDRAVTAARYPARVVTPTIIGVAMPVYSKMTTGERSLSDAYALVNFFLIRVLLPFGLVFLLIPENFMQGLLGEKWIASAPVLRILAVYAVMHPVVENFKVLFYALGRPGDVAIARIVQITVFLPAIVVLVAMEGVTGAAWAMVASILAMYIAFIVRAGTHVEVSLWKTLVLPVLVATGAGFVFTLLPHTGIQHPILALLVHGAIIFTLFGAMELVVESRALRENIGVVRGAFRSRDASSDEGT